MCTTAHGEGEWGGGGRFVAVFVTINLMGKVKDMSQEEGGSTTDVGLMFLRWAKKGRQEVNTPTNADCYDYRNVSRSVTESHHGKPVDMCTDTHRCTCVCAVR